MAKKSVTKERISLEMPAFILGILSIVLGLTLASPVAGLALGVLGIVFSSRQKSQVSKKALILSIIGTAISVLIILWAVLLAAKGVM